MREYNGQAFRQVRCKYVVWPCGDSEHGAGRRLSLSASPHVAKLDVDGGGVGSGIGVPLRM